MGAYADNLRRRMQKGAKESLPLPIDTSVERLVSVAIQRAGETYSCGFQSHYALRLALSGDGEERHQGDVEGFLTSTGRFVERREAADIALQAGQIRSVTGRELLSSDIDW